MKKGFTLIELLVVVLIIGILSSVALPQYTKAVHRARATEAWTLARSLRTAQDVYFMANNEYATNVEDLDIQIPEMKNWNATFSAGNNMWDMTLTGKGGMSEFQLRFYGNSSSAYAVCTGEINVCKILLPCTITLGSTNGTYCEW